MTHRNNPAPADIESITAQGRRTHITRDDTELRRLRNRKYRRASAALVRRDQITKDDS